MKAHKIIGLVVRTSKATGTVGTTIYAEVPHDDYARKADKCVGSACIEEYVRGDFSDLAVGSVVHLIYGKGYDDKAVLENILPAKVKTTTTEK